MSKRVQVKLNTLPPCFLVLKKYVWVPEYTWAHVTPIEETNEPCRTSSRTQSVPLSENAKPEDAFEASDSCKGNRIIF